MHHTHVHTSVGYISGEVKLGIALRLLAGGDSLDLDAPFDISTNGVKIFSIRCHLNGLSISTYEGWILMHIFLILKN